MSEERLRRVLHKAAEKALMEWLPHQWDRQAYQVDDLSQDLWSWYLDKRPATRKKMEDLSEPEAIHTALRHARQILSKQTLAGNTFQGRTLYSADSVREALRGQSTNKYLKSILPHARETLLSRNRRQAEAVMRRYDEGEVSAEPAEKMALSRAVESLTEEVNVMYLTSEGECVGSGSAVFPDTRKQKGGYSDPTGDTVALLDEHPEYRFHVYEDTPIREFIGGAAAQPKFRLGKIDGLVAHYRRTG